LYKTAKGTEYWPDEPGQIAECPVSYITPKSTQLLQIFSIAGRAHDASGAALYGPNLSEWPAWAVDAIDAIEQARIDEHNSRVAAEHHEYELEHGKG